MSVEAHEIIPGLRFQSAQDRPLAEIWGGPALAALREEFAASRPGIDCEHCVVKKSSTPEEDDDFPDALGYLVQCASAARRAQNFRPHWRREAQQLETCLPGY